MEKNNKEELELIMEKIYDYIMTKLYDKIYPLEPKDQDYKIFQQSIRLAWTEPKHFIEKKRTLVFGNFLNDIFKYFKLIDTEKSPRKKIIHMTEIFNCIGFLLKFNGVGSDAGVDDQMPILNYAFIKAQPFRFYSNALFMQLYIGEQKNKFAGSNLTQLMGICDFIPKIDYSKLIGVTKEEYFDKCSKATFESP